MKDEDLGELTFSAKYEPKDGKWKVLVEAPNDCFVVEGDGLAGTLSSGALRLQGLGQSGS